MSRRRRQRPDPREGQPAASADVEWLRHLSLNMHMLADTFRAEHEAVIALYSRSPVPLGRAGRPATGDQEIGHAFATVNGALIDACEVLTYHVAAAEERTALANLLGSVGCTLPEE